MPSYITQNGDKYLDFDDGSKAPVVTIVPLTGGLQVALTAAQLTALTPPPNPTEFPLPAAQLAQLIPPANPTSFPLPAAQITALTPPANPTEFPLPTTQAGWLQNLRDRVFNYAQGSGDFNANTFRVVVCANQPEIAAAPTGATQGVINTSASAGLKTIATPAAGKRLRISSITLQAATPVRFTMRANTTAISGQLTVVDFDKTYPEPILLPVDAPLIFDVDAATPFAMTGFIVYREI